MIQSLAIPIHNFILKKHDSKVYIFDDIRKKYIQLTPEEWVRQNFIMFLVSYKGYNKNLISVEKCFVNNKQKKRYDVLIYKNNEPKLLIECKSPSVKLNGSVLHQIQTYNYKLKAPYIIITNGIRYICAKYNYTSNISYNMVNYIPNFHDL